jgi:hypothetical protein
LILKKIIASKSLWHAGCSSFCANEKYKKILLEYKSV